MKKLTAFFFILAVSGALAACTAAETTGKTDKSADKTKTAKDSTEYITAVDGSKVAKPERFPKGPVTILVGSTAGGGTDIMSRALAEPMSELMGVAVNIVNREGASGTIAADECAKAKPDGYTVIAGMPAPWYIKPHLSDLTYDPFKDFRNISVISPDEPLVIVVPADSQIGDFEQVVQMMKDGEKVVWGTSNPGSVGNCGLSDLFMKMDIYGKFEMVPFAGAADALTSLIGGHITISTADLAEAAPRVANGTLKAIAVFGNERCEALPDVPCLKELGFDNTDWVIAFKWISVPVDTPDEIVDYLKAVIDLSVMSDSYKEFIKSQNGLDTYTMSEEDLEKKLKECYDAYDEVLTATGQHK